MENDYYNTYRHLGKNQLFHIILHPQEYQERAISAAKQVVHERSWTSELDILLENQTREKENNEEENSANIAEKAAYYQSAIEYKKQDNSFQVRIADIPRFESELHDKDIPFYREDKNIGAQLDIYPTQTYYFKNEYAGAVDLLVKEIGLITAPYADYKPFFKFEMIVGMIAIVIILTLFAIFL